MSVRALVGIVRNGAQSFRPLVGSASSTTSKRFVSSMKLKHNSQSIFRAESTQKPNFTTSTYSEAKQRMLVQAKLAGKITGYTVLSMTTAIAVVWQMSHWYIEYVLEPTPSELGYQARNLLHGAYIRENIAIDNEVAAFYVREALKIALEEKKLEESSDTVIQLRRRLAYNEARAGNLLDAITEYTRSWKLLMDRKDTSLALSEVAKNIGDLYFRIGDTEHAEEFLAWALHNLKQKNDNSKESLVLQSKITLTLASLYALQRQFDLSLPLLTQTLKTVPEDDVCLKAIIQNQLSETMYGLGRVEESMGWAQAALNSSSHDTRNQDCLECGGVAANNLGKLLELKGEFDDALEYYKQAVKFASSVYDSETYDKYVVNLEKVQEIIDNKKK